MRAPLQIQPYLSFLGTHEGLSGVVLPELFSPNGSQNVWMDEFGRVKRISGYAKINSSAVTTDTGGSATRVLGLAPFRSISGGSVTRQLLGVFDDATNENELWFSTNGGSTWTFIVDFGSGSVGRGLSVAQYKNVAYLANGVVAPRKWDGTSQATAGLVASPTPTATGTSNNNGRLSGNYKYKLVSMEAAGVKHGGSAASAVETVQTGTVAVSWTADADTDVIGYELYRTTGTGELYYFVSWIEGRTTVSYTDTASDQAIIERKSLADHGEAPPTGAHFVVTHGDRLWYLRTDAQPSRGWFSDLALPESVGTFSWLDFSDPASFTEQITAGVGNFQRKLVVFTERSVWTVSGTGAVIGGLVDFSKKRTNAGTGAINDRAVVRVPTGSVWRDEQGMPHRTEQVTLAYLTPNKDIRIFDGDQDAIISWPVKDTLANVAGGVHAVHDVTRKQIVWYYTPTAGSSTTDAIVWNYLTGVMYYWTGFSCASSTVIDSATDPAIVVLGEALTATGGHVYTYFSGNSFNGADIVASWFSGTLMGRLGEDTTGRETPLPALPYTKRFRWADIVFEDSDVAVTVGWYPGFATATASPAASRSITLSAGTGREDDIARVLLKDSSGNYLHDEGMRLKVSSSGTAAPWAINALYIAYQNLPGLKRRSQ